jgi:hypothetical protein
MATLFSKDKLYPQNKVNMADYAVSGLFEVTELYVHNPVKVALATVGSVANADVLWLINNIRNPFKDLTLGRLLQVPLPTQASSVPIAGGTSKAKPIKVKNARINGQKITY